MSPSAAVQEIKKAKVEEWPKGSACQAVVMGGDPMALAAQRCPRVSWSIMSSYLVMASSF